MKTVVIFGGSGFIGQNIIRRLAKRRFRIIVPYQIPIDESKLRLYGKLGQIIPIKLSMISEDKIKKIIKNSDAILNLKTIWREKKVSKYKESILKFNIKLTNLINLTNKNQPFIFFSGIGVDEFSKSARIQNIYESEKYILQNLNNVSIVRPSLVIGEGSQFLNKLVTAIRISFFVPIFGSGRAKIQPVFVDDVAKAVVEILEKKNNGKNIYELGGPEVYTYKSFYQLIIKILGLNRLLIYIPFNLSVIIISILEKTLFSVLTKEQLLLLKSDNVSSGKEKTFSDLGISPKNISEIIRNIYKNI